MTNKPTYRGQAEEPLNIRLTFEKMVAEKGIITYKISKNMELLLKCSGEDKELLTTLLIDLKSVYKMKLKVKLGLSDVSHRYIYVLFSPSN